MHKNLVSLFNLFTETTVQNQNLILQKYLLSKLLWLNFYNSVYKKKHLMTLTIIHLFLIF